MYIKSSSLSSKTNFNQFIAITTTIFLLIIVGLLLNSYEVAKPYFYKRSGSKLINQINFSTPSIYQKQTPTIQAKDALPFCLIIMGRSFEQKQMINTSITGVKYSNYKVFDGGFAPLSKGYEDYFKLVNQNCGKDDIIMFVSNRLQVFSLEYLNRYHQNKNSYMLYDSRNTILEVISFSRKVFDTISTQAQQIYDTNQVYLNSGQWIPQRQAHTLAIFQLSALNMDKVDKQNVFQEGSSKSSFFWMSLKSGNLFSWYQYTPLPNSFQTKS